MTSLMAVSTYSPSESQSIIGILQGLGLRDNQIKLYHRVYGYSEVRKDDGGSVADLMLSAAANLTALKGHEHQVRYVMGARTIQMAAPYPENPLQAICRKLGLFRATSFVVSQHACASGLLAIYLSDRLLAADGDPEQLALVFTGEKAFSPTTQLIQDTAVMGETSAAFLVKGGFGPDQMLSYATRIVGRFSSAPFLTKELSLNFSAIYSEILGEVLLAAIKRAGAELTDIKLILPHNVNQISWMRLCKEIGMPIGRIFLENISRHGHCFCADTFINYESACQAGLLQPGDRYVMVSVGLGATFSAMVFRH